MKLRIYRTFTWELAIPQSEVRLGGRNPFKLVAHDELQYNNTGLMVDWAPVLVVEAEKPEHPHEAKDREFAKRQSEAIVKSIEAGKAMERKEHPLSRLAPCDEGAYFFVDGKKYPISQPCFNGLQIKSIASVPGNFKLFLDNSGTERPDLHIRDNTEVHFKTDAMRFYSVPPATFY